MSARCCCYANTYVVVECVVGLGWEGGEEVKGLIETGATAGDHNHRDRSDHQEAARYIPLCAFRPSMRSRAPLPRSRARDFARAMACRDPTSGMDSSSVSAVLPFTHSLARSLSHLPPLKSPTPHSPPPSPPTTLSKNLISPLRCPLLRPHPTTALTPATTNGSHPLGYPRTRRSPPRRRSASAPRSPPAAPSPRQPRALKLSL